METPWPKKVAGLVFGLTENDKIWILENKDALFAFLGTMKIKFKWRTCDGAVTKQEFYEYIKSVAEDYDNVYALPHHPPRENVYYAPYKPGEAKGKLDALIDLFLPNSEKDRVLIKAMFCSPFWGGSGGTRPAFVITATDEDTGGGRGVGKTTLSEIVSTLAGGLIDFSITGNIDDVKKRILTSEHERVIRFDNVKSNKLSSSDIESLITANKISGHRMYVGNQTKPNLFTYIFTYNDASLSKDLAQRSVVIKLDRPLYTGNWAKKVFDMVVKSAPDIIADIMEILKNPHEDQNINYRFSEWAGQVFYPCGGNKDSLGAVMLDAATLDADDDEGSYGKMGKEFNRILCFLIGAS